MQGHWMKTGGQVLHRDSRKHVRQTASLKLCSSELLGFLETSQGTRGGHGNPVSSPLSSFLFLWNVFKQIVVGGLMAPHRRAPPIPWMLWISWLTWQRGPHWCDYGFWDKESILENVITVILTRERGKRESRSERRPKWWKRGVSQGMWEPLGAEAARKQIPPRASRRNGALLVPWLCPVKPTFVLTLTAVR